jgi:hypothetical protein
MVRPSSGGPFRGRERGEKDVKRIDFREIMEKLFTSQ